MLTKHDLTEFQPKKNLGLKIENIISAPLVAASNANAMMLKEQTKFLMDFCFVKKGDLYDPVLIEMSLTKNFLEATENGQEMRTIRTTFMIPLMTIIPINSLAVNSVELDFEMEITSQSEKSSTYDRSFQNSSPSNNNEKETVLRGKVGGASKKSGEGNEKEDSTTKLSVKIQAAPLPLPVGVSTLLDLYVKSIQPIEKIKKKSKKKNK